MFTGIVAGTGTIREMSGEEVIRIVIDFQSVTTNNLETGASVSIDGTCLTVVQINSQNISFDVMRGETVGIVGKNGSGKSTLLQLICGTLNPTSGDIQINGRIAALLELGSGFNPEFTGRENIYFNAAISGVDKQEIDSRLTDILKFADIV